MSDGSQEDDSGKDGDDRRIQREVIGSECVEEGVLEYCEEERGLHREEGHGLGAESVEAAAIFGCDADGIAEGGRVEADDSEK